MYTEIHCESDYANMQLCLDALVKWADTWQLNISKQKCFQMDIGNVSSLKTGVANFLDDTSLSFVRYTRDLGVCVDDKLNFDLQIKAVATRAKQVMFLLMRSFLTKDIQNLLMGFKSYVQPILDYCSPVWSPHLIKHILMLESVQRIFTKRIPLLKGLMNTDSL